MSKMIRALVWNEYTASQKSGEVARLYPDGLHNAIAEFLNAADGITAKTATLEDPDQGAGRAALEETDVLLWWGHCAHEEVSDETTARITDAVQRGMGVVFLHSAHMSKPFRALLGSSCTLQWREACEKERLWITDPTHPIAQGLPDSFALEHEEMYGEPFDIPRPDSVVFTGWFAGGNVFRSGVTYARGRGKIFYFQPGHESHPTFLLPEVQQIIVNAVRWAAPEHGKLKELVCPHAATPAEPF